MAYDRADWHYGGDFPRGLPRENGATHIGMFLAWAIMNHLEGELHRGDSSVSLERVRDRKMTGWDFLIKECDEKFWEEDLNAEGNAFAQWYYSVGEGYGPYIGDYEKALTTNLPGMYHVENSWENYDKLAPIIDARYRQWKAEQTAKK